MAGNTIDVFEDLYDNIDDLLNFSCEDIDLDMKFSSEDIMGSESSRLNEAKDVWQAPQDNQSHYSCDSFISGGGINPQLPTELLVPYEDIAHLEWLSNFVEESFSPVNTTLVDQDLIFNNYNNNNNHKENNDPQQFQTPSPVSVLDSSNSCSEIKTMPIHPEIVVPGRARSKRPRPTSFKHPSMIPLMPPTSSVFDPMPQFPSSELCSSFEHSAEYRKALNMAKACGKEPKKKKAKMSPMLASFEESSLEPSTSVRKCLHCGITKTPQWRLGPLGPKTLCNACGVRYKSGRLFPEYRPAASPTFVASLHSNSHKKVLEMRTKGDHNKEDLWLNDNSPLITYEGREKLLY